MIQCPECSLGPWDGFEMTSFHTSLFHDIFIGFNLDFGLGNSLSPLDFSLSSIFLIRVPVS